SSASFECVYETKPFIEAAPSRMKRMSVWPVELSTNDRWLLPLFSMSRLSAAPIAPEGNVVTAPLAPRMCIFFGGDAVRKPTLPVLATKIEFVGAVPVTVTGTFEFVMSSIENLFAPPLAESLAVSCQSTFGKPVPVLVSSNLRRVLFSLRRTVSKPNDSLLTQSRPTHALP